MTFNRSWGYTPIDTEWKTAKTVVGMLREVASGGGNLLLNIGPTPEGFVPEPCGQVLTEVAEWVKKYGPSIYDATDSVPSDWLVTGAFTRKANTLYYHVHAWPGSELAIGGLVCKIKSVKLMGGWEVGFRQKRDRLVIFGLPEKAPDPLATVLELEFEGEPKMLLGAGHVLLDEDPWA
jgi:alpha-L-fucosidase